MLYRTDFVFLLVVEVLLPEIVFENDEVTVHLIGTPPLAAPEQPEE